MRFSSKEIQSRRPVWEGMSVFFLDTELTSDDELAIANSIKASHYSLEELRHIFYREVAPALVYSLWAATPPWEGYDVDELEQIIISKPHLWIQRLPLLLLSIRNLGQIWKHLEKLLGSG